MADEKDEGRRNLTKKKQQQEIDFKTVTGPREFTRTGALHAVVKLIATNDQVNLF
jgi:hypothetical protein